MQTLFAGNLNLYYSQYLSVSRIKGLPWVVDKILMGKDGKEFEIGEKVVALASGRAIIWAADVIGTLSMEDDGNFSVIDAHVMARCKSIISAFLKAGQIVLIEMVSCNSWLILLYCFIHPTFSYFIAPFFFPSFQLPKQRRFRNNAPPDLACFPLLTPNI